MSNLRLHFLDSLNDFVFSLDLKLLSLEYVEILLRIIPNEQELKAFKEYEKEKKPLDQLADEDRFMMNVCRSVHDEHLCYHNFSWMFLVLLFYYLLFCV